MPKVQFIGQVLPEIMTISVRSGLTFNWGYPELGLEISYMVEIANSVVTVNCETNRFTGDDLTALYRQAHDIAQASVNLVAFSVGLGLVVVLHTAVSPNGTRIPLLLGDPTLPPLCTVFEATSDLSEPNVSFDAVYQLVLTEPALFMALNDLIGAINGSHECVVNCARAVERIRHMMAPPGTTTKDSWVIMRDNLQLDRAYIEVITAASVAPRHGDSSHIPGSITTVISQRAWVIMNRFLEYRKRGNQPLPLSSFPLLVS